MLTLHLLSKTIMRKLTLLAACCYFWNDGDSSEKTDKDSSRSKTDSVVQRSKTILMKQYLLLP
jgi:hypothetical protein